MRATAKWVAVGAIMMIGTALGSGGIWAKPAKRVAAEPIYSLCTAGEEIVFNFNAPQTGPGSGGFPGEEGDELEPFLGKDVVSVCLNRATYKLRLSAAENGVVRLNVTPTADSKFRYVHAYGGDKALGWGYLCFDQLGVRYQLTFYNPADIGASFVIIDETGRERNFFAAYSDGEETRWRGKRYWYLEGLNVEYLQPDGKTLRNSQRLAEIFFEPGVMSNFSDFAFSESADYSAAVCRGEHAS